MDDVESLRARVVELEAALATMTDDRDGYAQRNRTDSAAFLEAKLRTQALAKAAQAILDLHAEHEKAPI